MSARLGFAARLWFYFRVGYSTYLTFMLGYTTTLVTVYYLAVKNIPGLLVVFPRFVPFAILATVIGVPVAVTTGWIHLKRSPAYRSELEIGIEANPYFYKLPPGYLIVYSSVFLEVLVQLERLLRDQGLLQDNEAARIKSLADKLKILLSGGYVGSPRIRI